LKAVIAQTPGGLQLNMKCILSSRYTFPLSVRKILFGVILNLYRSKISFIPYDASLQDFIFRVF
jgi:hypothetical protein